LHQDSASKRDDAGLGIRESLNQRFTHLLLLSAVAGGHSGHPQKNSQTRVLQISVAVSLFVQHVDQGFDGRFISSDHPHPVTVLEGVSVDRALECFKRKLLLLGLEPVQQLVFNCHQAGVFGIAGAAGSVWPVMGWPAAMRLCCLTSAPVIGTVPVFGLSLMGCSL
jgi:hypothetical protein